MHPQHWPKTSITRAQVVIIGGATAVTLMPAMAPDTAHITMLQRTLSHIMPVPRGSDRQERKLLGEERGFKVNRQRSILQQKAIYQFCQRFPGAARKLIRKVNEKQLPRASTSTSTSTAVRPVGPAAVRRAQRRHGKEIRNGDASVVTANIKTFDATGIQLDDGTTSTPTSSSPRPD